MRLTITGLSIDYARKARAGMSPFCVVLTLLVAGSLPVPAATIGLCNTGFAGPSTLLAPCGTLGDNQAATIDRNYSLVPSTSAWVVLSKGFPLPSPWIPDTLISQWIGPAADQTFGLCCAPGLYDYRLTFSTSGSETILGRWASDNDAKMVLDTSTANTLVSLSGSFTEWTPFSFGVGPGTHTLDFQVTNSGTFNATGVRVEFAPEPSAFSLLGGGLALVLLGRRKFISRFFVGTLG